MEDAHFSKGAEKLKAGRKPVTQSLLLTYIMPFEAETHTLRFWRILVQPF